MLLANGALQSVWMDCGTAAAPLTDTSLAQVMVAGRTWATALVVTVMSPVVTSTLVGQPAPPLVAVAVAQLVVVSCQECRRLVVNESPTFNVPISTFIPRFVSTRRTFCAGTWP